MCDGQTQLASSQGPIPMPMDAKEGFNRRFDRRFDKRFDRRFDRQEINSIALFLSFWVLLQAKAASASVCRLAGVT